MKTSPPQIDLFNSEPAHTSMNCALVHNILAPDDFKIISIADVLTDIKTEKYKPAIDALPSATTDKKAYTAAKKTLPAWALNGEFSGNVKNDHFTESNGLFHIDIDGIEDPHALKKQLVHEIPEIYGVWVSPSGYGLKGLLRIPDDLIKNDSDFKKAYAQIAKYLAVYDVVIDASCKDVRRLCFVGSDKDIYINTAAPAFTFDPVQWDYKPTKPTATTKQPTKKTPQTNSSNKQNIERCCDILRKATAGGYHNARLRAGKLAGGYIAAGLIEELEVMRALSDASDTISSQCGDSAEVVEKEQRAIYDGIQHGKGLPIEQSSDTGNQPTINLSNPKESEVFCAAIIENLTDCTNELEAINAVIEAIKSNNARGINKTIAGYFAGQIAQNVKGLKGKKAAINKGVIDAVKIAKTEERTAFTHYPNSTVQAINVPLPVESFPNIVPLDNGSIHILSTVSNLKWLLMNYGITAVYDEVAKSQELIFAAQQNTLNHDLHNEAAVQQLCSQAALNGINENIVNKLPILLTENTINPVKDFIFSKKWDGISRIYELCSCLVVANEDRELTNKIMKVWLIQCIAALDRAVIGCAANENAVAKYELVLTFQGIQGVTKTTWLSSLLPREYKNEKFSSRYIITGSTLQLDNKDSIKQNISCWINELGELDATFRKSDIAALKAFLSKLRDVLRLPYAKSECSFARSTSFCASVNDEQFLNDSSGSRRFGVVKLNAVENNTTDMQQLWAEIWELYASGAQWWLDKATENAMQLRNERHQTINPIEDAILTRFNWEESQTWWANRMTMTEIYQSCFDKKPSKADLNLIKPFLTKKGVKVSKSNGCVVGFMPRFKNSGYQ